MSDLKNLERLYVSITLAIEKIETYNAEKQDGDKERFLVYDFTSKRPDNALSLLNRANKYVYILPCSEIDRFVQKPGEYSLSDEVALCNQQLDHDHESVRITFLKLFVNTEGRYSLSIGAFDPPPLPVWFGTKKSLSTVPRLEELGLPKNFSLKRL
jgi:hypothetical protein